MQVFIHDLCDNIQSTGRGIPVKENAQTYTDDQNIAENIQFLTVGHGTKIRKDFFKYSKKDREHDAGIYGFYTKFPTAGKKADNQKYDIQNHRDRRQRKWDEVGQYDSKTGDTADRGMAWYQEKIYRSSNDRDSNGQYDCFHKDFCVIQLCFHKRKSFFIFKVLFNSELPDLEDLP